MILTTQEFIFHLIVSSKIAAREPECFQVRDQEFLEQFLEPRKTLLLLSWGRIGIPSGVAWFWLLRNLFFHLTIILKTATLVNLNAFRFANYQQRVLEPNKTLLLLSWCRIEIHKGGHDLDYSRNLYCVIVLKIATWVNQSVFRFVGNVIANNKAEWRDWDKSGTGECGGMGECDLWGTFHYLNSQGC